MPLVTTASLVERARAGHHGVAAFNVITLEHAEAIAEGADTAGAGVILQVSENAVRYHGGRVRPLAAALCALAEESAAPLSLHLDHVQDLDLLRQAAVAGASSVMVDASRLDYASNVAATREAAAWAHDHGLWIEAELGEIGGKDGAHAPGVRTDPDDAADFVAATGVDGLAVAVGSSHAMVDRTAGLDLDLVAALAGRIGPPLVLHGSSGVPDATLAAAVVAGIVKVNIGTILNVAFTAAVRERLASEPTLTDPRRYLGPARSAVADTVTALLAVVGPAGGRP
ncbi:class II fructose-bisphosphate aldolase [Dermatophilaceae bacterium Soc4.6]